MTPPRPAPAGRLAVAVLARHPAVEGKTRLTAGVDPAHAAALRRALLLDTLEAVGALGWPVHVFLDAGPARVRGEGPVPHDLREVTAAGVQWHPQGAGDLGARMVAAIAGTLSCGHEAVMLVGSDVPDLPREAMAAAGRALTTGDGIPPVVFGPSADGGFYLVGTADPHLLATAFDGITWSRPSVLDDVTARLVAAGGRVHRVSSWRDIDTPDDLMALVASASAGATRTRALARALPRDASSRGPIEPRDG